MPGQGGPGTSCGPSRTCPGWKATAGRALRGLARSLCADASLHAVRPTTKASESLGLLHDAQAWKQERTC